MDTEATQRRHALPFELRFELTLHRNGPAAAWQAELAELAAGPQLQSESLPALMHYLVQLELPAPPPSGIR